MSSALSSRVSNSDRSNPPQEGMNNRFARVTLLPAPLRLSCGVSGTVYRGVGGMDSGDSLLWLAGMHTGDA